MQVELNFDLDDMVGFFERSSASEIYEKLYYQIHGSTKTVVRSYIESGASLGVGIRNYLVKLTIDSLGLTDTIEGISENLQIGDNEYNSWLYLIFKLRNDVVTYVKANFGSPSLEDSVKGKLDRLARIKDHVAFKKDLDKTFEYPEEPREYFDIRSVGAAQYDKAAAIIRDIVGPQAEPYLKEHRLLGEYRRTLDYVLQLVFALSTSECPDEIKTKIYPGSATMFDEEDYKAFISWLETHPKSNTFEVDEFLQEGIERLHQRIQNLAGFPITSLKIYDYREDLFNSLNIVFQPPNAES